MRKPFAAIAAGVTFGLAALTAHAQTPIKISYQPALDWALPFYAAAEKGWLEEKAAVLEIMTGLKRAGAGLIVTYWARELAEWTRR